MNRHLQSTRPDLPQPDALESSVSWQDLATIWFRWRGWFLLGLLIVCAALWIRGESFEPEIYRAEASLYLRNRLTPMAFQEVFGIAPSEYREREDEYHALVLITLARQFLQSRSLLKESAERLAQPGEDTDLDPIDLHRLLGVDDPEAHGDDALATRLQGRIYTHQLENTGAMIFGVELPDPEASARMTNACVEVLKTRMTDEVFGAFDALLAMYRRALGTVAPETWKRHLQGKIRRLELATSPQAREAAQPVRVIEPAAPPDAPIRPRILASILMGAALYVMVFGAAVALCGLARGCWGGGRPRRTIDQPNDQTSDRASSET